MTRPVFRLAADAVPDYPESNLWVDLLRWCLAVMDHDDKDMGFLASLLSFATKDGLTAKQAKYAQRAVDRIRHEWMTNTLDCQIPQSSGFGLAGVVARGTA